MLRGLDPSLGAGVLVFALEREVLIPLGHFEQAQQRLDSVLRPTSGDLSGLTQRVELQALGLSSRVARLAGRDDSAERALDRMDAILAERQASGQLAFYWAERRLARAERAALELARGQFERAHQLLTANLEELTGALGSAAHREETRAQIADLNQAWGRSGKP